MKCPHCGAEVKEGDTFCGECGEQIHWKTDEKPLLGELIINAVKKVEKKGKGMKEKYPHLLATILGYIFAFYGGLVGIPFGIYLLTREHPKTKFHGKIILALSIIILFLMILLSLNL